MSNEHSNAARKFLVQQKERYSSKTITKATLLRYTSAVFATLPSMLLAISSEAELMVALRGSGPYVVRGSMGTVGRTLYRRVQSGESRSVVNNYLRDLKRRVEDGMLSAHTADRYKVAVYGVFENLLRHMSSRRQLLSCLENSSYYVGGSLRSVAVRLYDLARYSAAFHEASS